MISLWGWKEGPEYETKNYVFFSPVLTCFPFACMSFHIATVSVGEATLKSQLWNLPIASLEDTELQQSYSREMSALVI